LIEVIVAGALLVVVGLLLYVFLGQGLRLYSEETESAAAQHDLRVVLSEITNKARVTSPDDIAMSNGSLVIDNLTYALSGDEVTRNGAVIADDIALFSASITDGLLEVTIRNSEGSEISTSLFIAQ